MASACDMFEYYAQSKMCRFLPHLSLKDKNLWDVMEIDSIGSASLFILTCGDSSVHNLLADSDLESQDLNGISLLCLFLFQYIFRTFNTQRTCARWNLLKHWNR